MFNGWPEWLSDDSNNPSYRRYLNQMQRVVNGDSKKSNCDRALTPAATAREEFEEIILVYPPQPKFERIVLPKPEPLVLDQITIPSELVLRNTILTHSRFLIDYLTIPEDEPEKPVFSIVIQDKTVRVWGEFVKVIMHCANRKQPHECMTGWSTTRPMDLEACDDILPPLNVKSRRTQVIDTRRLGSSAQTLYDYLIELPDRGLNIGIDLKAKRITILGASKMFVHLTDHGFRTFEDLPEYRPREDEFNESFTNLALP